MPLMCLSEFDGLDDASRLAGAIIRLAPDSAVTVLDCELRIVVLEGGVYARRGYDVGPLVGRRARDVIPASEWSDLERQWIAAVAGEPRTFDWASADEQREYSLHFAPLRTKAGALVGAVSVARDVTARVTAPRAGVGARGSLAPGGVSCGHLLEPIRRAFVEDGFVDRTRPVVDICTGITVMHVLTLDLPTTGGRTLSPAGYGATVREFGLSTEIDDLLVRRALRLAHEDLAVAVGVSAESLADPVLARRFEHAVDDAQVDPTLLTFELPVAGVAANGASASALVHRLHALGCGITVHDFSLRGTNPGFLKPHPVGCIKLDAGAVHGLAPGSPRAPHVAAVVELARSLGMRTAADGVADAAVLDFLQELGVDQAEGPLFSDPATPTEHRP